MSLRSDYLILRLVSVAEEESDSVAKDLFRRAGRHLGRHVRAVLINAQHVVSVQRYSLLIHTLSLRTRHVR